MRCTWTPWELRDSHDEEQAEDRAESVRIGYVAATRAKDLLVVSASGMGPWEESWLTPVYGALYPEKDNWHTPERYQPLNPPGLTTVLDFPYDTEACTSVRPGMHRTAAGNRVFWFDPKMLPPASQVIYGLHRSEMLDGTEHQRDAGFQAWNQWRDTRAALIAKAEQPTIKRCLRAKPASRRKRIKLNLK